jgi:hypothetical protein
MEAERAELSSVSTTLDEVSSRVEQLADGLQGQRQDALAADLYEVERALRMAQRRLAQVRRRLG